MPDSNIITSDDVDRVYHKYIFRKILFILVVLLGCIIVAGISLSYNGLNLSFLECYEYIIKHIIGHEYVLHSEEWFIDYNLWNIYTPRIAIAIIAGCGLAVCGVIMQSVFSNPLADPYTTGISDGATLGATVAIITGLSFANAAASMGIVINAFVGALIPATIIILITSAVRISPATLILMGVALSGICSGLQTVLMYSAGPNELTEALRWGIGSFTQTQWKDCYIPAAVTLVGVVISGFLYKKLNLLTLGETGAKSLGMDVEKFKILCMLIVTFVAASIICFVGVIGFVGLIAPHMVRMILGGDTKYVIPASMIVGTLFLLLSDLISRIVVYPDELRVGLIMSVIGAPIFLYMILKRKKSYGEVF